MRVIRADAMGLCFGVRDALEAIESIADPRDVTIYGELVHNEAVLVQLDTRGFHRTPELVREQTPETSNVLITAHGISDRERRRLQGADKILIDTTCPLVRRVHLAAQSLASKGYHVLVIGRPGHVEVRGIIEDLESFDIVGSLADVRFVNTVCEPTRERQSAVERLCRQVDVVVVVGGANSNNTRQLVALCERLGTRAHHVQSAEGLNPAWFAGCTSVGLTAGTSTLDETVEAVYQRLRRLPERACA